MKNDMYGQIDRRIIKLIRRLDAYRGGPRKAAWLVGGAVRDLVLGRPLKDYDLCTALSPDEVRFALADLSVIPSGLVHGTVTVLARGLTCELTTLRSESGYQDGRHPDAVCFIDDLEEDLIRRDFTINAMAWHPDDGLIDPLNGQADIRACLIRAVGDASNRFSEDGLRVLRALRFSAELNFQIEEKTAAALRSSAGMLRQIARERIRTESLSCMRQAAMPKLWHDFPEVWVHVFPFVSHSLSAADAGSDRERIQREYFRSHFLDAYDPSWPSILQLAFFFRPIAKCEEAYRKQAYRDFRCSRNEINQLEILYAILTGGLAKLKGKNMREKSRHALRQWQENWSLALQLARSIPEDDLWLPRSVESGELSTLQEQTDTVRLQRLAVCRGDLNIDGNDLQMLGVRQGPDIGRVLDQLLDAIIAEQLDNENSKLIAYAEVLLKKRQKVPQSS